MPRGTAHRDTIWVARCISIERPRGHATGQGRRGRSHRAKGYQSHSTLHTPQVNGGQQKEGWVWAKTRHDRSTVYKQRMGGEMTPMSLRPRACSPNPTDRHATCVPWTAIMKPIGVGAQSLLATTTINLSHSRQYLHSTTSSTSAPRHGHQNDSRGAYHDCDASPRVVSLPLPFMKLTIRRGGYPRPSPLGSLITCGGL
jgi:hypothetical protein